MPTLLTIWIFIQCYLFVQKNISRYINLGIVHLILKFSDEYPKDLLMDYWVHGIGQITGFVIALIGVIILGAFLASFVGRTLWRLVEKAFFSVPLVKQVYQPLRQITDFLLTKKEISFNKVVAIQYPRSGVWSVGLATGKGIKRIVSAHQREFLTVFVPTSPTPFTGYVIMTPKDETIELDMTIEEALRFTISGGVITPSESDEFEEFRQSR